jgi:hypothetical protein
MKCEIPDNPGSEHFLSVPTATTCPHTISFLERRQECRPVELQAIRVANGACFRKFARHPRCCALADYKFGLAVGGNDQLPPFSQSVHQPGIVIKLTNGYSFHAVRRYRLTNRKSSTDLPHGQVLARATISPMTTSFCSIHLMSSMRLNLLSAAEGITVGAGTMIYPHRISKLSPAPRIMGLFRVTTTFLSRTTKLEATGFPAFAA